MGKAFMDEDFLLSNETARRLYHETAARLPIIDYHCHINPKDIADNLRFENITQAWLYGDHYKWRAMRACGVEERCITGDADDRTKYMAYAACLPLLIGNPLYHWSHLELKRYAGVDGPLTHGRDEEIWERANAALRETPVRAIMEKSGVEAICTTDDPADTLEYHRAIAADASFTPLVLPAFRPDRALAAEKPGYAAYLAQLGEAAGVTIDSLDRLKAALSRRLDAFDALGCRAADHGLTAFPSASDDAMASSALAMALEGRTPPPDMADALRVALLLFLAREYDRRDWVMEIHFGVLRDTHTAMYGRLGPDSGFDVMGQESGIPALARFLDTLAAEDTLPKTLLFSINPADNAPLCTLCGAFGPRVKPGSAWWFNDTLDGMREQLTTYASLLPLGKFTGFLTDSRSFLSYSRHEYFRRLLCDWIGRRVDGGEYPDDRESLELLVKGICLYNTKDFFEI